MSCASFYRIVLLLLLIPLLTKSQDGDTLGGGLKKDCDADILMYLAPTGFSSNSKLDLSKYPKWDLTEKYLRKDWNKIVQGAQGSCTSFAIAFAISIQRNIDNQLFLNTKSLIQYSPAFIFNIAKSKYSEPFKSNCKEGISFIDAYLVVRDRGLPSIDIFPYIATNIGCQNQKIIETVYSNAEKTKIAIFQRPFRTIDNFKRILVDTPFYPICIGVYINNEYENALLLNNGEWKKPGQSSGTKMHAMLLVGFDEAKHAFKVMDWQGEDKGDKGCLWMDYSLIENDKIVFDAYICSHQTEYIDYRIGSRTSSEMNETEDVPESMKKVLSNKVFDNDRISFWIKSGYYTLKDVFKISCNYVSDANNVATFRIYESDTGELIQDDMVIKEGHGKCFTYKGISYKLTLVEIASRGKNIFKKAAVLIFTRNEDCN